MKKYCVNNLYFGKNEKQYKVDNFIYSIQNSNKNLKNEKKDLIPLLQNCFISKKYIKKIKIKINKLNCQKYQFV